MGYPKIGRRPLASVAVLALVAFAFACNTAEQPSAEAPVRGREVLTDSGESLGRVDFPTSCDPAAQPNLELGLALLHHMNYTKARPVFEAAAEADAECAMAHWGTAMTLVHPLWPDSVAGEQFAQGAALLARAAEAEHTSAREAGYVAALAAYFEDVERSEWDRLAAALEGWTALHEANPDDDEAATFHALFLLANAPAEDKTYARQREAAAILENVLARLPKHPGAHHYAIHAHDFPPLAADALDIARRYDDLAPENTHALHMTSHIFTRLGLWPESIEFNIRAAAAASERTAQGMVSLHHLHALDYLAYAHLQRADDAAADAVLETLQGLEPPFQNHAATAYAFAAVPARLALERHDWERAANLEPGWPEDVAWGKYPYLGAISQFAIAMGSAHVGELGRARTAIDALERLEREADALDIAYDWAIQVRIQRVAAEAWLAYHSGNVEEALELAEEAAELEGTTEKNPVTPGEVLPARELFGDMLLATGGYAEARAAYEAALQRSPNRFNSLFGAARSAAEAGDPDAARASYAQLLEVCPEPTGEHPELDAAREFMDSSTAGHQ